MITQNVTLKQYSQEDKIQKRSEILILDLC